MASPAHRLLEELGLIRDRAGEIGPDHPRFRRWHLEVTSYLRGQGDGTPLRRFERLSFARGASMWKREESSPRQLRLFREDLEEARGVLEEAEEAPIGGARHPREASGGEPMDANMDALDRKSLLTPAGRNQALERLMAQLEAELKRPDSSVEAAQGVMTELLAFKRLGGVLDRLRAEASKSDAPWESVREAMAELWAVRKDLLIDLLPSLLNG